MPLPHSPEAERAILGGILLAPESIDAIAPRLAIEDFYRQDSQTLYAAMLALRQSGEPIDRLTLQANLERQGAFQQIGGAAYLAALDLDLPDLSRLDRYADLVLDRSGHRQLIQAGETLIRECRDGAGQDCSASAALERHSAILDRVRLAGIVRARIPRAVRVEDLLAQKPPPRSWIAEGLLQDRDVAMVHSWRGVGKTYFTCGLAWAIASGSIFLRHRVPVPTPVLVCDGEMPREDLWSRFDAFSKAAEEQPAAPLLILSSDLSEETPLASLTTSAGQHAVELNLAGLGSGSRLLILDSLSTLCRSEAPENDAASWDEMQAWLLRLRRQGVTTLFCHHDSKASAQRGTSKREDILSQSIHLVRPADYAAEQGARFEVHFTKARGVHGAAAEPYEAWLRSDPEGRQEWAVRGLGAIKVEQARAMQREGQSIRKIAEELGVSKSAVQRWLRVTEG